MAIENTTRIERLEVLAETILLSIQQLSVQQQTHAQQSITNTQAIARIAQRQEAIEQTLDRVSQQQEANTAQIAANAEAIDRLTERQNANAEQIAINTAGLIEFRNLVADYIQARSQIQGNP
jgi:hypothetical protein